MIMLRRSSPRGYVIALIGAGLLLLIDQTVDSFEVRNFLLAVNFFLTVVLASAVGGWKPGMVATVLAMAVHVYAFVEPRYDLKLPPQREVLRILAYCIAGGAVSFLSEALQRAWDRVRERQQELELANQRKNEFLATLAHELRNPLAPLRNGVQVLRLAGGDPAVAEDCLAMMERQLAHTARLVDDLLDVSRISRGRIELRKQHLELREVIEHAVETSRSVIEAAGHQLTIDVPLTPIVVDGDVTRLAQVVSNMLNNAAKYTDCGGSIRLSVKQEGREAVIRVRDNGIGIPASMLPHVFEMFAQIDRSAPRTQGGLGIGLSLAKVLVELHGGEITVHSDGPGRGAEFTIRLPVVADEQPCVSDAASELPGSKSAVRILVVDDNRDGANSLATLLRVLGNQVSVARDGTSALKMAEQDRPALILLDIGLPDLDGYEVCRRVRAESWGRPMQIVAITGWGQAEDRRRSKEAGFDDHLVKPMAPGAITELLARISEVKP
jgi:signal transduction histidine kinase/CheY-like chemotaxis protein